MTTARGFVTEFCLMGDRVEALESVNRLIREERARAHAEGKAEGRREMAEEAAAKCDEYERIQVENASHYERDGDGHEKHMAYAVVWSEAAAMLRALSPHLPAGEER